MRAKPSPPRAPWELGAHPRLTPMAGGGCRGWLGAGAGRDGGSMGGCQSSPGSPALPRCLKAPCRASPSLPRPQPSPQPPINRKMLSVTIEGYPPMSPPVPFPLHTPRCRWSIPKAPRLGEPYKPPCSSPSPFACSGGAGGGRLSGDPPISTLGGGQLLPSLPGRLQPRCCS